MEKSKNNAEQIFSRGYVLMAQKRDFMIYLIPTYDCNLRCTYCFVPKYGGYKINTYTLEELAICLEKFVQTEKLTVGILGGEPFLYKDLLVETISFLSERLSGYSLEFYIGTNGLLIDETVLYALKNIDKRVEIAFSIDGEPKTLIQDRMKGKESLAMKLITNLHLAKKILGRENISITMTIAESSIDSFEKNIMYLFSLNPYFLRFRLAAGDTWSQTTMKKYLEQYYRICLFYIQRIYIEKGIETLPLIEQFEQIINMQMRNLGPCSKGINLTLTPDGYFVPCYNFLTKEKQEQYKFPYPVSLLAKTSDYDEKFQLWRAQSQSQNNGKVDENGETLKDRYNFAMCINGEFTGQERESILSAWDYREKEERKIGAKIFHYYYTQHSINLTQERIYKR